MQVSGQPGYPLLHISCLPTFNRARRIKCDETKPTCLRCARSDRKCAGFPAGAPSNTSGSAVTSDSRVESSLQPGDANNGMILASSHHLRYRPDETATEWQQLLGQKGVGLIAYDSFVVFGSSGAVLDTLLPQLCYSIPAINSAAIALGAVHQLQTSHKPHTPQDETFVHSQYQKALRTMQQEVATQPHGPVPLMLMCFMLGIMEILLQQERNALYHMRAAYQLLQERKQARNLTGANDSKSTDDEWWQEDDLEVVFRTLDLETCAYAPDNPPDLPVASIPPVLPVMTDLASSRVTLVQLVHSCYAFTAQVYRYKYHPHSATPDVHIQQGRLIAHLSSWLERFNLNIVATLSSNTTHSSQITNRSHALTLRVTALSTLIYLSCILSPYETTYDAHAPHFQRIIKDAEEIVSLRTLTDDTVTTSFVTQGSNVRFSPGPGIINPLSITAIRYRHPEYRRKAVALLFRAGQEGPWFGRREASVAARVIAIEEEPYSVHISESQSSPSLANTTPSSNDGIVNNSEDVSEVLTSTTTPLSLYNTSIPPDNLGQSQDTITPVDPKAQHPISLDTLTPPASLPPNSTLSTPPSLKFPPERHRIHGESIVFPVPANSSNRARYRRGTLRSLPTTSSKSETGGVQSNTKPLSLLLRLSRCRDIATMLTCEHGPWGHEDTGTKYSTTSRTNQPPSPNPNPNSSPDPVSPSKIKPYQTGGGELVVNEIPETDMEADTSTDFPFRNTAINPNSNGDVDLNIDTYTNSADGTEQISSEAEIEIGNDQVNEMDDAETKTRCRGHEQWEMWDEILVF